MLDLDDMFAFTAPKKVVIRDARLGLLNIGMKVAIAGYIGFSVLLGDGALRKLAPDVEATMQPISDYNTTCKSEGCDNLHWPVKPYCTELNYTVTQFSKVALERCASWVDAHGVVGLTKEYVFAKHQGLSCGDLDWGSEVLGVRFASPKSVKKALQVGTGGGSLLAWVEDGGEYRKTTVEAADVDARSRTFVADGNRTVSSNALLELAAGLEENGHVELLHTDLRRVTGYPVPDVPFPHPCFQWSADSMSRIVSRNHIFVSMITNVWIRGKSDAIAQRPMQSGGGLVGDMPDMKKFVGRMFTGEPFHGHMLTVAFGSPLRDIAVTKADIVSLDISTDTFSDMRPLHIVSSNMTSAPEIRQFNLGLPELALRAKLDPETCAWNCVCEVVIDAHFYNEVTLLQLLTGQAAEIKLRVSVAGLRAYFNHDIKEWQVDADTVLVKEGHGLKIRLRTSSSISVFSWKQLFVFLGASSSIITLSVSAVIAVATSSFFVGHRSHLYKTYLSEHSVDMSYVEAEMSKEFGGDVGLAMTKLAQLRLKDQLTLGGAVSSRSATEMDELLG